MLGFVLGATMPSKPRKPSFRTADLDRLNDHVAAIGLDTRDATVWQELLAIGRQLAHVRETAEASGLIVGSAPVTAELGDIQDAFRRSYGSGGRAIVGNVPPRR
jgi:hypothetical protein